MQSTSSFFCVAAANSQGQSHPLLKDTRTYAWQLLNARVVGKDAYLNGVTYHPAKGVQVQLKASSLVRAVCHGQSSGEREEMALVSVRVLDFAHGGSKHVSLIGIPLVAIRSTLSASSSSAAASPRELGAADVRIFDIFNAEPVVGDQLSESELTRFAAACANWFNLLSDALKQQAEAKHPQPQPQQSYQQIASCSVLAQPHLTRELRDRAHAHWSPPSHSAADLKKVHKLEQTIAQLREQLKRKPVQGRATHHERHEPEAVAPPALPIQQSAASSSAPSPTRKRRSSKTRRRNRASLKLTSKSLPTRKTFLHITHRQQRKL